MEDVHTRTMAAALIAVGLLAGAGVGVAAQQQTIPSPTTMQVPEPATVGFPAPVSHILGGANGLPSPASRTAPPATTMQPPVPASRTVPPASNQPEQTNQGFAATSGLPLHSAPNRQPRTVHDVRVPGNITFQGWRMALNGTGVHTTWFFFDKYVAALYLSEPTQIAAAAISGRGAKAIWLSMLTDMSKDDFVSSLHDAFKASLPNKQASPKMQKKWQRFASLFTDLKARDKVLIAYIPDQGVSVSINGKTRGPIPGEIFARAILGMWLGNTPIDSDVKNRMLGQIH